MGSFYSVYFHTYCLFTLSIPHIALSICVPFFCLAAIFCVDVCVIFCYADAVLWCYHCHRLIPKLFACLLQLLWENYKRWKYYIVLMPLKPMIYKKKASKIMLSTHSKNVYKQFIHTRIHTHKKKHKIKFKCFVLLFFSTSEINGNNNDDDVEKEEEENDRKTSKRKRDKKNCECLQYMSKWKIEWPKMRALQRRVYECICVLSLYQSHSIGARTHTFHFYSFQHFDHFPRVYALVAKRCITIKDIMWFSVWWNGFTINIFLSFFFSSLCCRSLFISSIIYGSCCFFFFLWKRLLSIRSTIAHIGRSSFPRYWLT